MARPRLADSAMESILDRIVDGTYPKGTALPPEAELAAQLDVSRPTMREAVRVLDERGVVQVVHGRGTFVNDMQEWRDLPTLIDVWNRTSSPRKMGEHLTVLRRMIEVGAAELAAEHRNADDVARMHEILDEYERASEAEDVDLVVELDLEFHHRILAASGNPFLAPIMLALNDAAKPSRRITLAQPEVRARAHPHHRRILAAIEAGDQEQAKLAMDAHMTQTYDDLSTFAQPG